MSFFEHDLNLSSDDYYFGSDYGLHNSRHFKEIFFSLFFSPWYIIYKLPILLINHQWKICLWAVDEALAHPYLARLHDEADEPVCPEPFSFDFEQQSLGEEQIKDMIYQEALALNPGFA